MRTVLKNLDEVAEYYHKKRTAHGRNNSQNFHFEKNVIFSYSEPIGIRLNDGRYLLSGDRYSHTTNRHQNTLRSAIAGQSWLNNHDVSRYVEVPFSALARMIDAIDNPEKNHNTQFNIFRTTSNHFETRAQEIKIIDSKPEQWIPDSYTDPKTGEVKEYSRHVLGGCLFKLDDRLFVSGIDDSGRQGMLYYLTMIRSRRAKTLDQAYESMKPAPVKKAIRDGIECLRQGEWFLVPADIKPTAKQKKQITKYFSEKTLDDANCYLRNRDPERQDRHFATSAIKIKSKIYYAGTIRHINGDHRMLVLESGVFYKAYESPQVISFTASGAID